ncbi:hypothetical protein Q7P37_002150 [Cladosporium fusiforme]
MTFERRASTTIEPELDIPIRQTTTTRGKPQQHRNLEPAVLHATFPSSRRATESNQPPSQENPVPSSPPNSPIQANQTRLETALNHLARAAAHLSTNTPPPARSNTNPALEKLYTFAAPTWSRACWAEAVEMEAARLEAQEGGGASRLEVEDEDGVVLAGRWVGFAVDVLRCEGEEGEFWRDGRDLEVVWEGGGEGVGVGLMRCGGVWLPVDVIGGGLGS